MSILLDRKLVLIVVAQVVAGISPSVASNAGIIKELLKFGINKVA